MSAMDRLAAHGMRMFARLEGVAAETVTYHSRTSEAAVPVNHTSLVVHCEDYRHQEIDGEAILREDRRCRIQTALVTWVPTIHDTITRTDSTVWKVQAINEGPNRPFYLLQIRQVG